MQQRSMNHKVAEQIEWLHWTQGPEIMALLLHDMHLQLGLNPNEAKLLIREQELDSLERLIVLTKETVDDKCHEKTRQQKYQ